MLDAVMNVAKRLLGAVQIATAVSVKIIFRSSSTRHVQKSR